MWKTSTRVLLLPLALIICGCGGDSSTNTDTDPPPDTNPMVVTIEVRDNFFQPKSIRVQPGTTVRWVMRGSMTDHTSTSNDGVWDSGFRFRNSGDTFEHTFREADNNETFLYHCTTHWTSDEMQGSIQVGNNAPSPPPRY